VRLVSHEKQPFFPEKAIGDLLNCSILAAIMNIVEALFLAILVPVSILPGHHAAIFSSYGSIMTLLVISAKDIAEIMGTTCPRVAAEFVNATCKYWEWRSIYPQARFETPTCVRVNFETNKRRVCIL
jgi:hypothetical protein